MNDEINENEIINDLGILLSRKQCLKLIILTTESFKFRKGYNCDCGTPRTFYLAGIFEKKCESIHFFFPFLKGTC